MTRALIVFLMAMIIALPASAAAPFDPFGIARIDGNSGAIVPLDGILRDQDGRITSLRRLGHGLPLIVVPVLHDCPNICGITLAGVVDAARQQRHFVAGRDFAIVAFGIDPSETADAARADLARLESQTVQAHSLPVPIAATTGGQGPVHAVTDALGYHYAFDPRIGQYAHAAASAVLTPDGRLVGWLYGLSPDAAALDKALSDARAGRTGGLARQLILLCYHYDPVAGTYSLAIERLIRWAGVATVLGIVALILWLGRKPGGGERRA
ncbi:SCO family protein [Novosphingobium sp. BL-8H]|uniref:SCO family protein n=1 Tax=Novosphingobium sp. BL-8H TaxID=3127640 RepID=UPI003757DC3D